MRIESFILRALRVIFCRGLYVDVDPTDNSVTFSPRLVKDMRLRKLGEAKAVLHRVPTDLGGFCYGISLVKEVPDGHYVPDVQYNVKYKSFGFEANVNRMLYDMCLLPNYEYRFSVRKRSTDGGGTYYKLVNVWRRK